MDLYSLIYVFQAAAWFGGSYLIVFEYKRLHSEAWYANKLFWVLNLITILLTVGVLYKAYWKNKYILYSAAGNLLINSILVFFMFNTQKRTVGNKRPTYDEHLLGTPTQKARLLE